jgi:hypothetical protein
MDPMVGTALVMIFGLVTLASGLIALVVVIVARRVSRPATATAIVSAAVVMGCLMAIPPGYHPSEQKRVERLHAAFAPALERYRQTHGDYPPTLEAAGIATPQTEYGPLHYNTHISTEGTLYYEVSFGDYYDNGFTASFSSDRGEWYLDR